MAWHLYLCPVIGDGTDESPRRAKYMKSLPSAFPKFAMDYGFQPTMLVAANLDDATDAALQLNADVTKIPDDLDRQIGPAALSTVQNALETRHLPAAWVTEGITYRTLLRTVGGFFAFLQRYAAVANTTALTFGGGVNLDTRLNQLSAARRQELRDTAVSLGLDISGLGGATTLRAVLKTIADQWGQREIRLGPAVTI